MSNKLYLYIYINDFKKKNCVSNKIQYGMRIKNHSHESWPKKKKKLQNMF